MRLRLPCTGKAKNLPKREKTTVRCNKANFQDETCKRNFEKMRRVATKLGTAEIAKYAVLKGKHGKKPHLLALLMERDGDLSAALDLVEEETRAN